MASMRRRTVSFVLAAVLVALSLGALAAFANRQRIADFVAAQQFEPNAALQGVMDKLALSADGDLIFQASQPTLESSQLFSEQCAAVIHRESDKVVGCFTGQRIHLFEVTDERLNGMVEVTAAHELLHAAYARLSDAERQQLNTELWSEYERLSASQPELVERMKVYADLSDDAFVNELHSVLGTEVDDLSDALERHYARYFSDRSRVLALFESYSSAFRAIDSERTALTEELQAMGTEIDQRGAAYEQALAAYNEDVSSLIARNERYEFSSNPGLFYSLRDELNQRRGSLEQERNALNTLVDEFNAKRARLLELNALAEDLIKSIDSRFAPPASA